MEKIVRFSGAAFGLGALVNCSTKSSQNGLDLSSPEDPIEHYCRAKADLAEYTLENWSDKEKIKDYISNTFLDQIRPVCTEEEFKYQKEYHLGNWLSLSKEQMKVLPNWSIQKIEKKSDNQFIVVVGYELTEKEKREKFVLSHNYCCDIKLCSDGKWRKD